jgi:heterodisulfide reductase subunit A-like polyferredoxin
MLCVACGACENICPFQAVHVNGTSVVDWERCMGCGVCVDHCPQQAMTLARDERQGVPLDMRALATTT